MRSRCSTSLPGVRRGTRSLDQSVPPRQKFHGCDSIRTGASDPVGRTRAQTGARREHLAVLVAEAAADEPVAEAAEAQLKIANIHYQQMEKPDRDYTHALRAEEDFRDRLTAVLGVSTGLADHLARHPEDAELLRGAGVDRLAAYVERYDVTAGQRCACAGGEFREGCC